MVQSITANTFSTIFHEAIDHRKIIVVTTTFWNKITFIFVTKNFGQKKVKISFMF